MGRAARAGSIYLPIRHLAGRATANARPKNYNDYINAIWHAITKRWWHYTFDPKGAEVLTLDGPRIYSLTLNKGRPGRGGYGDCDDIAIASSALLGSIGMDTQLVCTAKPGSPFIFDHVFIQAKPPNSKKWITFDPVLFPKDQAPGNIAPHGRIATFDLYGKMLAKKGNFPPRFNEVMNLYGIDQADQVETIPTGEKGLGTMTYLNTRRPQFSDFADYTEQSGYFGDDPVVDENNQQHMARLQRDDVLPDFSVHGIVGFGCYAGGLGITQGDKVPHIMMEADDTDELGNTGLVRTKHFEMAPDDYMHLQQHGSPAVGTLALADDGEVYEWQGNYEGLGGFFKKLFKKARKKIRGAAKRIKKCVKKFIMRTKYGRKLWKAGSKVFASAMKIVKPLLKKLGPIAMKIAPIAAIVPGIGTLVATGLKLSGKVNQVAKRLNIKFGKGGAPIINSKKQGRLFAKLLAREGRKLGKGRALDLVKKYKRKRAGGGSLWGTDGVDGCTMGQVFASNAAYRLQHSGIGWV